MSLVKELRRDHNMPSRYAVARSHAEKRMAWYQRERDACIRQLQAGVVTHESDDGVQFEITYKTAADVRLRAALWERDQELAVMEMRAYVACVRAAWSSYSHRCKIAAQLKAAAMSRGELESTRVECELHRLDSAAHDAAAERSQRGRPLVVCHASNAPNRAVVNSTELRHAAMSVKEAAPT
jgi:hypothetical protein